MKKLEFDFVDRFSDGVAWVNKDGKWGYIDKNNISFKPYNMKILYLRDDIYSHDVQRQVVQWPEESYQVKYYLVWQYCEVKNISFQEAKGRLDKHLPLGRYISWDDLAALNLQTRFVDVESSQYFPIIDGVKCVTVDWLQKYHPQVDISKYDIIDA